MMYGNIAGIRAMVCGWNTTDNKRTARWQEHFIYLSRKDKEKKNKGIWTGFDSFF